MRKMYEHAQQRWSLRKLSVGVCSVLLGLTAMGGTAAFADSTPSNSSSTPVTFQTSSAAVQPSPADQSNSNYQNTVVPNGYASALDGFRPGETQSQALENVSQEGRTANTNDPNAPISQVSYGINSDGNNFVNFNVRYQHNPADEQEVVDPQNLTTSQEADLTNFAAGTINHIRQQVQSQTNGNRVSVGYLRTSPYASQVGNEIVHSAYDNFTGSGHNRDGLISAANNLGLNTSFVGENIGDLNDGLLVVRLRNRGAISNITMDMLKEDVYANIVAMMYQDYNDTDIGAGGHTTALLNDPEYNVTSPAGGNAVGLDSNGNAVGNQYFALTIDRRNQLHFNFISDANATDAVRRQLATNAVTPGLTSGQSGSTTGSSASSSAASSAASSTVSSATSSVISSANSSSTSSASSSTATSGAVSSATSSANSSAQSSAQSSTASSTSSSASSSTSSVASSATSSAVSSVVSSATSSANNSAQSGATSSAAASSTNSSVNSSTTSSATSSANTSSATSSETSNDQSSSTSSATSSAASSATSSATSQTTDRTDEINSLTSEAYDIIRRAQAMEINDLTNEANNIINQARELDLDNLISEARNLLNQARQQLAAGNASAAQQLAQRALGNLNQAKDLQAQLNDNAAFKTNVTTANVAKQNKLPQTGNSFVKSVALAGLGIVAFAMAIGLSAKRRRD